MKSKLHRITSLVFCLVSVWALHSCEKDNAAEGDGTDQQLYQMSKAAEGFVWYKNTSALLDKSPGSAHPQPLLRTRYNAIAAGRLDSDGKVLADATFPEGSLIVKELYENATTLGRYAILYKNSGSGDADTRGWVWGYINADGSIVDSASRRGRTCISCHSQAGNIDYMLMNKFFP